jgi:hypothetical protein
MNVDTGQFRALAEHVAELERRLAENERRIDDAVRLREIFDGTAEPRPRPRHLKAVE